MILDYKIDNVISSSNLIFSINFKVDNKEYDFYVKIGRYDYGKYNKFIYNELNQKNMDACCYTQENNDYFNNDLKYVYESIFYEKMTEIEATDIRLKNKIVRLNNRGIVEADCIYFLINKKKYKYVLDCKKIIRDGNPICTNIKNLFQNDYVFNNTELYYYITENDKTYKTLGEHMKEKKENKENEHLFFKLAIDICEDLRYLYEKYDFIHWDLHEDNILINDNLTKYKIFDFDKSQLTYKNIKYKSCVYFDSSLKKYILDFQEKI
jgi:serine/threonine protein kinase